jgi:hypothetical protein
MTGEPFEDESESPTDPEGGEHTHMTWEDRNMLRLPPEIRRDDYGSEAEWDERTRFWREGWDQPRE